MKAPILRLVTQFGGIFINDQIMTYAEKLQDTRWKHKRYDILVRDKNRCVYCYGKFTELDYQDYEYKNEFKIEVHHKFYLPNTEPWEYPNEALITLCEICHEIEDIAREKCFKYIPKHLVNDARQMILNGYSNTEVNLKYHYEICEGRFLSNDALYL